MKLWLNISCRDIEAFDTVYKELGKLASWGDKAGPGEINNELECIVNGDYNKLNRFKSKCNELKEHGLILEYDKTEVN